MAKTNVNGRKWLPWLLGGVVAVVVVVVGGRFVIHVIEGGSKPPLALSTVTTTPAAAGGTSSTLAGSSDASSGSGSTLDGMWNIGNGSQAGYRVQESLFGQSNTAVGRTSAITGNLTLSGTTVTAETVTVDLTKVSSDRSQRDDQFQGRIMNTSQFPTAKFVLTKPISLASLPAVGVQVSASATGDLTLHGVTKSVTFPVTAQRTTSAIQVQGSIPITFADWNINNPSGGPASVGTSGSLEFLLDFTHT
jgi:polyisoprenoid-binding protein YceI